MLLLRGRGFSWYKCLNAEADEQTTERQRLPPLLKQSTPRTWIALQHPCNTLATPLQFHFVTVLPYI